MNDKPLISVLMGTYNCAETLEEAVECIINQTYENWELIMCDDCSKDNTLEVAQRIAERDGRIHVIKNEINRTLAPSLNHCLQYANGKYIARMDGDDVCALDRFEKELNFLEAHPEFALVSCHMNLYDVDGVYRVIHYTETPTKESFLRTSQFCHAGCMMRTDVLRELGGYNEAENRCRVEDYDLWVRMYAAGYEGYNLQEILYSMRDDRNAVKRRTFSNRLNESRVKVQACRLFNLSASQYRYVILPIVKSLIPTVFYRVAHRK